MYHLLIERVSTVINGFLQYRVWAQFGFYQVGIEWIVVRTNLFAALDLIAELAQLFFLNGLLTKINTSPLPRVIIGNQQLRCYMLRKTRIVITLYSTMLQEPKVEKSQYLTVIIVRHLKLLFLFLLLSLSLLLVRPIYLRYSIPLLCSLELGIGMGLVVLQ
jgi:hypothetical protein